MIIDDLLENAPGLYHIDPSDIQQQRYEAIVETTRRQFEKNALYHQFCKQKNFDPRRDLKSIDNLKEIPFLTTANFKQRQGRPKELLLVPEAEIRTWTLSSGTSGDPSMIGRDYVNLVRYFKDFEAVMIDLFHLVDYQWSLLFMPPLPHHTIEDEEIVTMPHMPYIFDVANKVPYEDRMYALKMVDPDAPRESRYAFDPEGTFGFLGSSPGDRGTGWITGAVPLLYGTLSQFYKQTGRTFNVGEKTVVAAGGGWKGFTGQSVSKEDYRALMHNIFGIPEEQVFDNYSFTETNVKFAECEYHNMHAPQWAEIIVRDFENLEPVEVGEKGLIQILDPMAYSYAGASILQDDVVRIAMEDGCPCGRRGKVIEVLGRAEGAEAKGCGAQIADMTD